MASGCSVGTMTDIFTHIPPVLPDEAGEREKAIAAKYTRISFCLVGDTGDDSDDGWLAWLEIGQQSWSVTRIACASEDAASWHCWMLAKAILVLLDLENLRPEATQ